MYPGTHHPRLNVVASVATVTDRDAAADFGEVSGYEQLADLLRHKITAGELAPGARLPGEIDLAQTHGLARDTVRRATNVLHHEGLVEIRRGRGVFVFDRGEVTEVTPPPGSVVESRMPSPQERARLGVPTGWPVIVVTPPGGEPQLYPAHRYRVRMPDV